MNCFHLDVVLRNIRGEHKMNVSRYFQITSSHLVLEFIGRAEVTLQEISDHCSGATGLLMHSQEHGWQTTLPLHSSVEGGTQLDGGPSVTAAFRFTPYPDGITARQLYSEEDRESGVFLW